MKKINEIYPNRKNPYCSRTISGDLADVKAGLVETAQEMLGNQKVVVAAFLKKSFETRERAIQQGDLGLVYRIDKDIMKLVGVNIDAVDVNISFDDDANSDQPQTFFDLIRSIREERGLVEIEPDDL